VKKLWDHFWFQVDGRAQVFLFRKIFCWILFGSYFSRSFDLELLYSNEGLLQVASIPAVLFSDYRFSILNYLSGVNSLWLFHGLFLTSLVFLAFGCLTWFMSLVALFCHLSFIHRNLGAVYGADTIATYYLFYLCLFEIGESKIFKKIPLSSAVFRLMQIQLCVIYAYSGFEKLRGASWWNGDALWYALMNSQVSRWNMSWVFHDSGASVWFSLPIALASYGVVLWEVYFPVLVWSKRWKFWILGTGAVIHAMIGICFRIPFFAAVMVCAYLLFLDSKELKHFTQFFKKILSRFKLA